MTDLDAMLRAVLLDPADDANRLVYADCLEERGQPGDAERAEFIRVQVELAAIPACRVPGRCMNDIGPCGAWCVRRSALRDREREVLLNNGFSKQWRPSDGFTIGGMMSSRWLLLNNGFPEPWKLFYGGVNFTFSRGFVSAITCMQAGFLEHAATIFAAHPVEQVTLSDREPERHQPPEDEPNWSWYSEGFQTDRATLAECLFDALDDPPLLSLIPFRCAYFTRELALSALSDACVALGRKRAGLPPLPCHTVTFVQ